jgi:Tol biopolymer transport system component
MTARIWSWWLVMSLLAASYAGAAEQDRLDSLPAHSWSPDSQWLAFNWPHRNELLVLAPESGRGYLLKPLGAMVLDVGPVVATGAPVESGPAESVRTAKLVPSPGSGRFSVIDWSPDSTRLVYRLDRESRGVFSVVEERVVSRLAASEPLPWPGSEELQLVTETGRRDGGLRFWIRVRKPDGATVKEVVFDDLREVRQMSLTSYRQPSFLAPNGEYLLYLRGRDNGWQLVREFLAGNVRRVPLTAPRSNPPTQWRLAGDSRHLAVAEPGTLRVGTVDDWGNARTLPLDGDSITLSWSPDSRFLAYLQASSLSVLDREGGPPALLTRNCAQRLWGWRGSRLYFGNARTSAADLHYVRPPDQMEPEHIVKAGDWQTAPREVSVAPDGKRMVCVVSEIDGSGRSWWQLWQYAIPQGGPLLISTNDLAGGLIIQSKRVEIPREELTWELLYAVPIRP